MLEYILNLMIDQIMFYIHEGLKESDDNSFLRKRCLSNYLCNLSLRGAHVYLPVHIRGTPCTHSG